MRDIDNLGPRISIESESPLSLDVDKSRRFMRKVEVIMAYRAQEPVKSIALRYGIAPSTVIKYVNEAGLGLRNRKNDPSLIRALAKCYARGVKIKTICNAYRVDRKLVWLAAKKYNLPLRLSQRGKSNEH